MSTRPKLTRRTTDRFLDRSTDVTAHPVSALLDAAGAAKGVGELPGEATAIAQFRAGAHLVAPAAGSRLRKLLAAPVVAVTAVGVLAGGGGLALAASYGKVDVPFIGHDNRSDQAPDAPSATNPGLTNTRGPRGTATGGSSADPSALPTPSFEGLCRAFQAGAFKDGKKARSFAALAARAGGRDQVAAFCVDLIGPPKAAPTHKPTTRPTPTKANPTKPTKPTAAATPTQRPKPTAAAHPTKAGATRSPKS